MKQFKDYIFNTYCKIPERPSLSSLSQYEQDRRYRRLQKNMEAMDSAWKQWSKNKYMKIIEHEFQKWECHHDTDPVIAQMQEALKQIAKAPSKGSSSLLFFTISPRKDVNIEQFKTKILALANRKMFDSYFVVFEQRETSFIEGTNNGCHTHMLLEKSKKYKVGKVRNRTLDYLLTQKWFPDKTRDSLRHKSYISLQNPKYDMIWKKLDYLLGKKDEFKLGKVEFDSKWRTKHNIQKYYYRNLEKKILLYIHNNGKKKIQQEKKEVQSQAQVEEGKLL